MNKEEKFEQLSCLAQKLGLSPQEVGEYFLSKTGKDPSSPVTYKTPEQVLPGMYVYADGLISTELIAGRQVKAVVGYVEDKTVYAVCLQEEYLPWSGDWLEAGVTQNMTDGQKATRKILEISRKQRQKAEAAQWCYDYAEDGVKQGEAFLASIDEWKKLFVNAVAINVSFKALSAALLEGWYWSSTECNNIGAWKFGVSYGGRAYYGKYNNYIYVRPVLKIQL